MDATCKACGESLLHSKGYRPLQRLQYTALFEISSATGQFRAAEVHKVLAAAPSYVCKQCNSTLSKYGNIVEDIKRIERHVSSKLVAEPGYSEAVSDGCNH